MKGCVFNKLTILCVATVFGSLLFMLSKMLPKSLFPESERYGIYYNPYNDMYMGFFDDPTNDDYRYITFSRVPSQIPSDSTDYIKIEKSVDTNFFIFFFTDTIGQLNVLCPSEEILGSKIVSVNSNKFIIDTISRERSLNFILDEHTGYYNLSVRNYSSMKCIEGFVSLAYLNSLYTPLCSIRR